MIFKKLIVRSGMYTDNFHLCAQQASTSGNRYYEISGTANVKSPIQLGALQWGLRTDTHSGNITLIINGGVFGQEHAINLDKNNTDGKITNATGTVSAVINNGIADTTAFVIDPKVQYVIKSGKGGKVTLAAEGSATAAPTFLIKADTNNAILINGTKVADVNGEYTFKPETTGEYVVAYEEKLTEVEFSITLGGKGETSSVIVDNYTGYDGRAVLEIEGVEPIYLEAADGKASHVTTNVGLMSGEYTFKVKKPGYITYTSTLTVNSDGTFIMDTIPELIAGDISNNFDVTEGDGKIDIDDFIRILRGISNEEGENTTLLRQIVDLNEDGTVNVQDLSLIKANYGKTTADYSTDAE